MKLTQLYGQKLSEKTVLDIAVQIIEIYKEYGEGTVVRPENFQAECPDRNECFDLSYSFSLPFSQDFCPIPQSDRFDEKDCLFCTAVIAYSLATGTQPDLKKALSLAEMLDGDSNFSFLTSEKACGTSVSTPLWNFISQASGLDKKSRPSLSEAMTRIISENPSSAKILVTDAVSGKCISVESAENDRVFSTWKYGSSFSSEGKRYIPQYSDEISLRYRLFEKEYVFSVIPYADPSPELQPLSSIPQKNCIGIDFGAYSGSVSFVNGNGITENVLMNIRYESSDPLNNLKYIYQSTLEKLGAENVKSVLAVPAGADPCTKTVLLELSEKAGFSPDIITSAEAVALFFSSRNNFSGKLMIVDIGEYATDISTAEVSEGKAKLLGTSETAEFSGSILTDILFGELVSTLSLRYGISIGEPETPFYSENCASLRSTAQELKERLSFEEKVSADIRLNGAEQVQVTVKRKKYGILMKEKLSALKLQIEKAVRNSGNTGTLLLVGGTSAVPSVKDMFSELSEKYGFSLVIPDCPDAVSRGSALYCGRIEESSENRQYLPLLMYDIGILTAGAYGERPVFRCMAGTETPLGKDGIEVKTFCVPDDEEIKNNMCRLYLYSRPKEYSCVQSTFDPDGDSIRPAGFLCVRNFPQNFGNKNDKIQFTLNFDPQECISAKAMFITENGTAETEAEVSVHSLRRGISGICKESFI